jgi:hypothetical protein
MEFRGNVLVHYTDTTAKTCWTDRAGPELQFEVPESGALDSIAEEAITNYVESQGIEYLNQFSHGDGWVNCPEGRAKVPADVWHCKITDEPCPIQAQIELDDKELFFDGCNLEDHEKKVRGKHGKSPQEHKKGIWGAVTSGDYRGHHHDPGSVPCSFCDEGKFREEYYFPWEVTRLSDHVDDYESARTSRELVISDLAYDLKNTICADCFISLSESYPGIEFQSYGIDPSRYYAVEYSYRPQS